MLKRHQETASIFFKGITGSVGQESPFYFSAYLLPFLASKAL